MSMNGCESVSQLIADINNNTNSDSVLHIDRYSMPSTTTTTESVSTVYTTDQ